LDIVLSAGQITQSYYQIDEVRARVVQRVFGLYSVQGISIGTIAGLLNELAIPTSKRHGRWERSTRLGYAPQSGVRPSVLWQDEACTAPADHAADTDARRHHPPQSASHERPLDHDRRAADRQRRDLCARAGTARGPQNSRAAMDHHAKHRARVASRTKCEHRRDRAHARSTTIDVLAQTLGGYFSSSICNNRPVRQDLLDEVVWTEIVRLLEEPELIQKELDRGSRPRERPIRQNAVRRRSNATSFVPARALIVCSQPIGRLLSLDELRERMPNLWRREQADNAKLRAIVDRAAYLHLADTLTVFLKRLGSGRNGHRPEPCFTIASEAVEHPLGPFNSTR
jgi:site-specific DNA recombinase